MTRPRLKRESVSPIAGTPEPRQRATHITQEQPAFTDEELKFFRDGDLISEGLLERES